MNMCVGREDSCFQDTGSLRPFSHWVSCREAPKPTSSSPAGWSTPLMAVEETKAQKPQDRAEPRAHGPACSEGPNGLLGI